MIFLEIIGWAFIAGCALAAFVAPVVVLVLILTPAQKESSDG